MCTTCCLLADDAKGANDRNLHDVARRTGCRIRMAFARQSLALGTFRSLAELNFPPSWDAVAHPRVAWTRAW